MTLQEAEKAFGIPIETLQKYVTNGLIQNKNHEDENFDESCFERLGLIQTLLDAEFTIEETKRYLTLTEHMGSDDEQIRMLQKGRRSLLNNIHKKQQLLDSLDFMIRDKQK